MLANEISHLVGSWRDPQAYVQGLENGLVMTGVVAVTRSTTKVAAAGAVVKRPHGNSKLSRESQILHNLIEHGTGEIAKIGVTQVKIGRDRYSESFYRDNNVDYVPVARFSNRLMAYAVEKASLIG